MIWKLTSVEKLNSINQEISKCYICNFPLEVNPKGVPTPPEEISYLDFHIRKEHKFLRKILREDQLKK